MRSSLTGSSGVLLLALGVAWRDALSVSVHVYCTCTMYVYVSMYVCISSVCGCGGVHAILPWPGGVGVPWSRADTEVLCYTVEA
jgi:hypothetical protein